MRQDKRLLRLNEQFRREISGILQRDVEDPRIGRPIVTSVRVTPDLWLARVFVRLPTDPDSRREAQEGLEAAAPFIRKRLGRSLRIRRIPELRFLPDDTLDDAMRIEELLREVGGDWDSEEDEAGDVDGGEG